MALSRIITTGSLNIAILVGSITFAPGFANATIITETAISVNSANVANSEKAAKPAGKQHLYCPAHVGRRCGEKPVRPRQNPFHDPRCHTGIRQN
ncbi:MAG: hypothetical protein ABIW76_23115 [Fibrobacteria bacterium]